MKKSIRKSIAAFIAVLTLASSATISFAAEEITPNTDNGNSTAVVAETDEITPRADDIRWVYKYGADGNLYKRRYNYSTNSWYDAKWVRA